MSEPSTIRTGTADPVSGGSRVRRSPDAPAPRPTAYARAASLAVAGLVLTLAAGCSDAPAASEPSSSSSPRASVSASPSASASASGEPSSSASPGATVAPTASPTPTAEATAAPSPGATIAPSDPAAEPPVPIGAGCLDLVSLDTMYAYSPNVALDDQYRPTGGSLGESALSNGGVACGWVQQSSGESIEISAAHPSTASLAYLRSQAATGTPSSSGSGAEQYFSSSRGIGTVQAFSGGNWVVVASVGFTGAADAQPLVDSALAALG